MFERRSKEYKRISENPRRYKHVVTGEIITREEYQRRTAAPPGESPIPPDGGAPAPTIRTHTPRKNPGAPGKTQSPRATLGLGAYGVGTQDTQGTQSYAQADPDGPTPVADMPPPPPGMQAATTMSEVIEETTKQVGAGNTALANIVGEALAMCLELVQDTKTGLEHRWMVLSRKEWERMTKPSMRIAARHLPIEISQDMNNPDAQDAAELFKGVMYAVTAMWANKQVFEREMRKLEHEYELEYDTRFGPGAYQRARADAAAETTGAAGNAGHSGGQPIIPIRSGNQGAASGAANAGAGNSGDGGKAAARIRELYTKYPGNAGRPFGNVG